MQGTSQPFGSTEKHTSFGRSVQLPDTSENHVPVGTTKVGGTSQACNGIFIGVGVVDHNVGGIVCLDLGRQIRVDLDAVVHVLGLHGKQQRSKPLKGAKVSADPEEVDLSQPCLLLGIVHAVPDGLEDRSKGRNTNTGSDEDRHFIFENVLRGRSEGSVNVNSGQNALQGWIGVFVSRNSNHLTRVAFLVPLAAQKSRDLLGKVAYATYVDGDVVLLRSAGQGKGVVLPERHSRATEENVLSGSRLGVLLLDLDLADIAGVLDDL